MCAIHHEQTTYGPPSAREEQETVRIDVVAYNRKRRMMPSDRRSDKGLPTMYMHSEGALHVRCLAEISS